MSLRFRSLGSGSAGNATLVESGDGLRRRNLLIDCGMPLRRETSPDAGNGQGQFCCAEI